MKTMLHIHAWGLNMKSNNICQPAVLRSALIGFSLLISSFSPTTPSNIVIVTQGKALQSVGWSPTQQYLFLGGKEGAVFSYSLRTQTVKECRIGKSSIDC